MRMQVHYNNQPRYQEGRTRVDEETKPFVQSATYQKKALQGDNINGAM